MSQAISQWYCPYSRIVRQRSRSCENETTHRSVAERAMRHPVREAGTRRQAFYNDHSPRKYRFRVIPCDNDGVWNETGASLDFSILSAYYQTVWFRALCGAAFLLLLWFINQYRHR